MRSRQRLKTIGLPLGAPVVVSNQKYRFITAEQLRQLGLDSRQLEIPGRKRLEIDHGKAIEEIIG